MLRFLADENFNNDILRGLRRRDPELDVIRAQDCGLYGAPDPTILEWAAQHGRLLLTHDISTMTRFAFERVKTGQSMPWVVEVRRELPLRAVIEDLLLLAHGSEEGEWEGRVLFLPL